MAWEIPTSLITWGSTDARLHITLLTISAAMRLRLRSLFICFESRTSSLCQFMGLVTATTTSGPRRHPRPTSSMPMVTVVVMCRRSEKGEEKTRAAAERIWVTYVSRPPPNVSTGKLHLSGIDSGRRRRWGWAVGGRSRFPLTAPLDPLFLLFQHQLPVRAGLLGHDRGHEGGLSHQARIPHVYPPTDLIAEIPETANPVGF